MAAALKFGDMTMNVALGIKRLWCVCGGAQPRLEQLKGKWEVRRQHV